MNYTAPSIAYTTQNAGTHSLTPSGGVASDYAFIYHAGTLTVNQAQPTLSLTDAQSVIYSGAAAVYPAGKISNSGDGTSYTWQYSVNGTTWNSGMPSGIGSYQVKATCAATTNYKAASAAAVGFSIVKAELTATYAGETVGYGQTPALTVTVTGFTGSDTAGNAAGYAAPTISNSNTAIGSYNLTPAGGAAANYSFVYVSGTLNIEQGNRRSPWPTARAWFITAARRSTPPGVSATAVTAPLTPGSIRSTARTGTAACQRAPVHTRSR